MKAILILVLMVGARGLFPRCENYKDTIKELTYLDLSTTELEPCIHTGYIEIDKETESNIFYWLFETRNNTQLNKPLVIWLNSSPGSSSVVGIFNEIGPFSYNFEGKEPILFFSKSSWLNEVNLLFLDQPIGTGFSYGYKRVTSDLEIANHFYIFIQKFMDMHSQFLNHDNGVILAGEPYAGKFAPLFA